MAVSSNGLNQAWPMPYWDKGDPRGRPPSAGTKTQTSSNDPWILVFSQDIFCFSDKTDPPVSSSEISDVFCRLQPAVSIITFTFMRNKRHRQEESPMPVALT